ncbi:hypothetical protein [Mycobacterium sp. AZCC_0083]|uniref:hypothetical protein n=1 Tax=Mycobacterium sp. AZCC_0083 TaxID=2735882 RepID=UPI0016147BFE|nr:hypothetical protein [Mycobacterium sp. AZCC_0083]MBB5167158.1 hypothetical protein [Mycobacterium sp. AZCC_0083]
MAKTQLEVIGRYAEGGWEDEHGTSYYNDRVRVGGYGDLGKLQVDFVEKYGRDDRVVGEYPIILRADPVVLIRRGFPDDWTTSTAGVSIELNPFGFQVFDLQAGNGMVRYRLVEDELYWKFGSFGDEQQDEENDRIANFQLGLLTYRDWKPVRAAPADERQEVTTKDLKLVDPSTIPADAQGIQL